MKKITLLLFLVSLGMFAQDTCSEALAITAGTYTVDEVNGTDVPSPICADNGVGQNTDSGEWFTYSPNQDYTVTVTTSLQINADAEPQRDTRFHVYTGTCGNLVCIAGDDDSGIQFLSEDTFNVTAGETYYIAFDDRWNDLGFDFRLTEGDVVEPPQTIITFTPQTVSTNGTLRATVDMNGDYLDDIVAISESNINVLYQQENGSFISTDIATTPADYTPSWSLTAGDIDGNGLNDLLYGGGQGVTFMFAQESDVPETPIEYIESSGTQYVFSQRSNFVDIDNDGDLDAFVCHDVEPNVYYINNGTFNDDGTPNMTFFQGGIGDTPNGGNYGSIWIDYDNDRDMDLFIAKCRGGNSVASTNQLHENDGNGNFSEIAASMNLADDVQTWSSAWGDFDNDGDMDGFIGASSLSAGGHQMMRNDGTTFTNITGGSIFESFTGTDIENVTHDFDNNGYLDIFTGSGNIFFNNGDMTFTRQETNFGSGPIGDLNDDGFLDIISGSIRYNDGNDNNWLKINTEGVQSNWNGIGARIEIVSALGTQIRDIRAGDGFRYMGSLNAHFGIGQDTAIESVTVYWPSGVTDIIQNPTINSTLFIREGQSLSVEEVTTVELSLYPNPASQFVTITGLQSQIESRDLNIYDVQGKKVSNFSSINNTVNISQLQAGLYFITVQENALETTLKFIKR